MFYSDLQSSGQRCCLLNTAVTMNTCYGPTKLNIKIIVLWDEGHLQKFKADLIHAEIEWTH